MTASLSRVNDSSSGQVRDQDGDTGLAHIDAAGRARMVDVSRKPWTRRQAVARCRVVLGNPAEKPGNAEEVDGGMRTARPLTELLEEARLAGIQAAKQTSRLIPLCHLLSSPAVSVTTTSVLEGVIELESQAEVVGPTGVEMEALTACAFAGLTLLAAFLPLHPGARIDALTLWEKSGGRSGTWRRTDAVRIADSGL